MDSLGLILSRLTDAFRALGLASGTQVENHASEIVRLTAVKGLTEEMVCQGKTPEAISRLWLHAVIHAVRLRNEVTDRGPFPLLPYSQVVFDTLEGNDAWNFDFSLRTTCEAVDATLLRNSIEKALANHPVFSLRIDTEGMQHYESGYRTPYFTYDMRVENEALVLHIHFNRILGDAASLGILLEDIGKAYFAQPLEPDTYFAYSKALVERKDSPEYQQHKQWLHEHFDGLTCLATPVPDYPEACFEDSLCGVHSEDLSSCEEAITALCRKHKISTNQFFCLTTALAMMDYNQSDAAALTWAYLGRESVDEQRIFGSLHRDVPFYISRTQQTTPEALIRQTREQVEQGILHSEYPYTFLASNRDYWKNAANVMLQPNIQEAISQSPIPFEYITDEKVQKAYCMFDVEITESPLIVQIKYSSSHYDPSSVARFACLLKKNAEWLTGKL